MNEHLGGVNTDNSPINGASVSQTYSRHHSQYFKRAGRREIIADLQAKQEELDQIEAQIQEVEARENALAERIKSASIDPGKAITQSQNLAQQRGKLVNQQSTLMNQIGSLEEQRGELQEGAEVQAINATQRFASSKYSQTNIASAAYHTQQQVGMYPVMQQMAQSSTTVSLQQREQQVGKEISQLKDSLMQAIGRKDMDQQAKIEKQLSEKIQEKGAVAGAIKQQRGSRIDDISLREEAGEFHYKLQEQLEERNLRRGVSVEGPDDIQNYAKRLEEAMVSAAEAAKKFQEAAEEAAEAELDPSRDPKDVQAAIDRRQTAREEYEAAKEGYSAASIQANEAVRQKRDFDAGKKDLANKLALGGDIAYTVSDAAYSAVKIPIERDTVRQKYADLQNRQWEDTKEAANFNVAATRRLLVSYKESQDVGNFARTAANVGEGAGYVGDALKGAGNTIMGFLTGGKLGAGAAIANTASQITQRGVRQFMGIPQSEAEIARFNSRLSMLDSLNAIENEQMQTAVDVRSNQATAMVGMGRNVISQNFDTISRSAFAKQAAAQGIDLNQLSQLTGMSAQLIGEDFNTDQILRAGRLQKAGFMSAQQTMGLQSQLLGAGGGGEDLEKIMASAVATGMDSAKSIAALTQGISRMAEDDAMTLGINNISGTSDMMMAGLRATQDSNLTAAQRRAAALKSAEFIQGASTDDAFNIANVSEYADIRNAANKAGVRLEAMDVQNLQAMGMGTLNTLSNMDDAELMKTLNEMGMTAFEGKDPAVARQFVGDVKRASGRNVLKKYTGIIAPNQAGYQDILAGAEEGAKFDELSKEAQATLRRAAVQAKIPAKVLYGQVSGTPLSEAERKAEMEKFQKIQDGEDAYGRVQEFKTARARREAETFEEGEKVTDKFGGTDELMKLMNQLGTAMQDNLVEGVQEAVKNQKLPGGAELTEASTAMNAAADAMGKLSQAIGGGFDVNIYMKDGDGRKSVRIRPNSGGQKLKGRETKGN